MIVNCRPLGPILVDSDDLDVLTLSHFLVGSPLTALPGRPADERLDRLTHWGLVKGMRDRLWRQWSREYLNTLQQRTKWTRKRQNLSIGDIVLIVDLALLTPVGKWPLGRVTSVKTGSDGLVRVAQMKTARGDYLRPITKLALLPVADRPSSATDEDKAPPPRPAVTDSASTF